MLKTVKIVIKNRSILLRERLYAGMVVFQRPAEEHGQGADFTARFLKFYF